MNKQDLLTKLGKGAAIAMAVGSMACASSNTMNQPASAGGTDGSQGGPVHCLGINDCKGHGTCAGAGNACNAQNSCKGEGWVEKASSEACFNAGGTVADG